MHCTSCENMVTANKMEVASFTNVKYTHTHTHTHTHHFLCIFLWCGESNPPKIKIPVKRLSLINPCRGDKSVLDWTLSLVHELQQV